METPAYIIRLRKEIADAKERINLLNVRKTHTPLVSRKVERIIRWERFCLILYMRALSRRLRYSEMLERKGLSN